MVRQKGFTLIELVVVIVILGLLAATALPRFVSLTANAREASVNGVAGGLRSAVALARAQYIVNGSSAAVVVAMDGQNVGVNAVTGIPLGTAAGIGTAMADPDGYDVVFTVPTAVTYTPTGASASCQAVYNGTTGVVTVSASVAGCP